MIFYVPVAYGRHLFNKWSGTAAPKAREQNIWRTHIEFEAYQLESMALGNKEFDQLLETEALDFPGWKDLDDPFRHLLNFRSQPDIEGLQNTFFDEVDLKTALGIYLIRINEKGKGMTLCLLPSNKPELVEVIELKPLSWHISMTGSGAITLLGFSDKGRYEKEIKPNIAINAKNYAGTCEACH